MTILYRPVLIESVEQAEALPDGALLTRDEHYAFQKDKGRFVSTDPHDLPVAHAWEVVGWSALVPIEAEEETERRIPFDGRSGEDLPPSKGGRYRRTVYTTPWEAS